MGASSERMTTPSLGRLLISHITLRGPELAQLYGLIVEHPGISFTDLVYQLVPKGAPDIEFGLDEAPLREALNFLLVVGLVAQSGPSRRKASFLPSPHLPGPSFPLLLLHHMYTHLDERQRAITQIHSQLVADDILALTPQALRNHMERSPTRVPFVWTGEKITFWTHIASYLGVARRLDRSQDVLIVPRPVLVKDALQWANTQSDARQSLYGCLQVIEEMFFTCFTSRGQVHRGLAQTLTAMHRLGTLRLTHSADAAHSLLLGDWRVSEVHLGG